MEHLFPEMMQSLAGAAQVLSGPFLLRDPARREELIDTISFLHARLIQLNGQLRFEYAFDGGLAPDIMRYTALLQEYEPSCREAVGYMLDRPAMFGNNSWDTYKQQFLIEVLEGITDHSRTISGILVPIGEPEEDTAG